MYVKIRIHVTTKLQLYQCDLIVGIRVFSCLGDAPSKYPCPQRLQVYRYERLQRCHHVRVWRRGQFRHQRPANVLVCHHRPLHYLQHHHNNLSSVCSKGKTITKTYG